MHPLDSTLASPGFTDLVLEGSALSVDVKDIARLAGCGPDSRWDSDIQSAADMARTLAQPRARWMPIHKEQVKSLFPNETPIEAIASAGPRWAFIATIGNAAELRAKDLLSAGQYLHGVLLDAAASVTADTFAAQVQARCAPGESSERFSPGYCSWSLEAQRTLFSLLKPEELGISLGSALLMEPLKSVSGIVVCAPKAALRVAPRFCRECNAVGCRRRPLAA